MPAPKIAVVNDDTQFLRMMHMILEDEGYDASVCFEQAHAFEFVRSLMPDLVILDIRMETPDGGWNLLDLLTLETTTAQIPVIVCSAAHDDLLLKQEYLTELGVRILLKPFKVEMLLDLVVEMLTFGTRDRVESGSST